MRNAKSYSEEFKADAVKLAQEVGQSKAAKDLGISSSTIHTWYMKSLGQKTSTHSVAREELSYNDILKKLKNAEKELRYAQEINKVLKKSLGIMTQDHPDIIKK